MSLYRVQSPVVIHTYTVIPVVVSYLSSHSCPGADCQKRGCQSAPTAPPTTTNIYSYSYNAMHVFMMVGETGVPTQARGEHANSTQKGPGTTWKDQDANPGPSCCEATVLTTEPPCCPCMCVSVCGRECLEEACVCVWECAKCHSAESSRRSRELQS